MKTQTIKKRFVSILAIMMFLIVAESANAQQGKNKKPPGGYFCNCSIRGFGCGTAGAKCVQYCAGLCGVANTFIPLKNISRLNTLSDQLSQSTTISLAIPQSEKNSAKIFDITAV